MSGMTKQRKSRWTKPESDTMDLNSQLGLNKLVQHQPIPAAPRACTEPPSFQAPPRVPDEDGGLGKSVPSELTPR